MVATVWRDLKSWPIDPAGYIFLPRAFLLVGKAMFGPSWVGDEGSAKLPDLGADGLGSKPPPPRLMVAETIRTLSDYLAAKAAMAAWAPNLDASPPQPTDAPINALMAINEPAAMPAGQWLRVRAAILEASELDRQARIETNKRVDSEARATLLAALPRVERYAAASRKIVELCEAGAIATAHREQAGGRMIAMPKAHWNTEYYGSRFDYGAYDPASPYKSRLPNSDWRYIFLSRCETEREITAISLTAQAGAVPPPIAPAIPEQPHLSRYLRFMLTIAEKAGVTRENQPNHASLMAQFVADWPSDLPRSDRLLKAMATLIREPESQAGRARKKRDGDA